MNVEKVDGAPGGNARSPMARHEYIPVDYRVEYGWSLGLHIHFMQATPWLLRMFEYRGRGPRAECRNAFLSNEIGVRRV